jgi:glycosyltransferase involved in cell wall biosynthesis
MDFDNPPQGIDDYNRDVREVFGIEKDDLLILQPTRVVKRKGIEHAIELVSRLGMKAKLVISHAAGDEGFDYEQRIREYAEVMNVETLFISDHVGEQRGTHEDGGKIYTLYDIYPHADLITYPSTFEGFGNALLEAVYFKKPIVINMYSIYQFDIKPKGFRVIEMPGYLTKDAIKKTVEILQDADIYQALVNHNYELGRRYFSYQVLQQELRAVITDCLGVEK